MGKFFSLLIISLLLLTLGACGANSGGGNNTTPATDPADTVDSLGDSATTPQEDASTATDTVNITYPAVIFADSPIEDYIAYAEANGFMAAVENPDGSVTVTMSKERQQRLLDTHKRAIDRIIEEYTADNDYVDEIWYQEDFSEVAIMVNRDLYEQLNFYHLPTTLGPAAVAYRRDAGLSVEATVHTADAATTEILDSAYFSD